MRPKIFLERIKVGRGSVYGWNAAIALCHSERAVSSSKAPYIKCKRRLLLESEGGAQAGGWTLLFSVLKFAAYCLRNT